MVVKNQKDFFAGIMFTVLGVAFAVGSRSYNMGDASHMGPGYFPFVLGIILAVLGLVVTLLSLRPANGGEQRVGRFAWKPLFYILAGNLVFGLCLGGLSVAGVTVFQPLGLVVGIYALVLIVSCAAQEHQFLSTFMSATVLALSCYLIFPVLLQLQLPVWPSFLVK